MNTYLSIFLVLQFCGRISLQNIIITEHDIVEKNNINDKLNYMDVLTEDLLNQPWEKEEASCLNKFLDIINNVKKSTLWAVWIWNSMQTPAGLLYGSQYNLGNYDQCMNSPWLETHPEFRTQYCLADIKLSETVPNNTIGGPYRSVKYYMNSMTKYQLKFNRITWGVCIPAECKTKSTSKFVRSMFINTHLGPEVYKIDVDHCQVAGIREEFTWGFYCLAIAIITVVIITVACTIINSKKNINNDNHDDLAILTRNPKQCQVLLNVVEDFCTWTGGLRTKPSKCYSLCLGRRDTKYTSYDPGLIIGDKGVATVVEAAPFKFLDNKLLKVFCLTTNTSSLNKLSKNDINVLHGLRALASVLVVCIHVVLLPHFIGFGNSLTLEKDMERLKLKALLRFDYTVDIFLLMSGLLRIKSYMAVGNINPFKAILKRYLRYVVTIGVIILFIIVVPNHIGDGPIWNLIVGKELKDCRKNWLISLLMLGNYVDNENMCYPILWTVACDFHLSVVATILYWLFQKNKKTAITVYGILTMAALILPGVVTYQENLTKIATFDFTITRNYKKMLATKTYTLTHFRGGPYFIGIALGYFMSTYKPDKHRNIISKLTSWIGIIFTLTIVAIIINVTGWVQDNQNSNELSSFVVSSIHRSIFSLAICCIIVVCEYGNVQLLRSVLTWHPFIPISKLSYGIYLVHSFIYFRILNTTRSPLHYDVFLLVTYSVSLITMSCIVSMLLYLLLEAPTNRITDIMIDIKADTGKKQTSKATSKFQNEVTHSNGVKKNK